MSDVRRGIGWAVEEMLRGGSVRRSGWNGKGMILEHVESATLRDGTGEGQETTPFIVMRTVQGEWVPWLCSQSDLLARDWEPAE